jgi:hypothetical protein
MVFVLLLKRVEKARKDLRWATMRYLVPCMGVWGTNINPNALYLDYCALPHIGTCINPIVLRYFSCSNEWRKHWKWTTVPYPIWEHSLTLVYCVLLAVQTSGKSTRGGPLCCTSYGGEGNYKCHWRDSSLLPGSYFLNPD